MGSVNNKWEASDKNERRPSIWKIFPLSHLVTMLNS